MQHKDPFAAVRSLRKRTLAGTIEVIHGDYAWIPSFRWNAPAPDHELSKLKSQQAPAIPPDYLAFLSEVSNGATIYEDPYGQWGYKILTAAELLPAQATWRDHFREEDWTSDTVAFAELIGEAHVMAFDLGQPSRDGFSCAVLEANPIDPRKWWAKASRSFHEWLDHLITAQGDKYWEWF